MRGVAAPEVGAPAIAFPSGKPALDTEALGGHFHCIVNKHHARSRLLCAQTPAELGRVHDIELEKSDSVRCFLHRCAPLIRKMTRNSMPS